MHCLLERVVSSPRCLYAIRGTEMPEGDQVV
jgi:hypothetical protein